MPKPALKIFYDGSCPICVREMSQLKHWDTNNQLKLIDVLGEQFQEQYPHIKSARAMQIMHAETREGGILQGLDASVAAWKLVNRKPWLAVLRWPLVKPLADLTYFLLAKNRYRISRLLTGKSRCERCILR